MSILDIVTLVFSGLALAISLFALYKNFLEKARVRLSTADTLNLVLAAGDGDSYCVNVLCSFTNPSAKLGSVQRLEGRITGPGGVDFEMAWRLFYIYAPGGREHKKAIDAHPVAVLPRESELVGIQFASRNRTPGFLWPAGRYRFSIRGWVDRESRDDDPNLEKTLHFDVSDKHHAYLVDWSRAPEKAWETYTDEDRALGCPVPVSEWSFS